MSIARRMAGRAGREVMPARSDPGLVGDRRLAIGGGLGSKLFEIRKKFQRRLRSSKSFKVYHQLRVGNGRIGAGIIENVIDLGGFGKLLIGTRPHRRLTGCRTPPAQTPENFSSTPPLGRRALRPIHRPGAATTAQACPKTAA